jgi:hypothetical protein
MKNKAYILKNDFELPDPEKFKEIRKRIKDGTYKTASEEFSRILKEAMVVIAKKGDLFFKSKVFKDKNGIEYMYPANVSISVLDKQDVSLGLGISFETNKWRLWNDYLRYNSWKWETCEFSEIETEELSFEQIHMIAVHNSRKKYLEEEISIRQKELENIDKNIEHIMS